MTHRLLLCSLAFLGAASASLPGLALAGSGRAELHVSVRVVDRCAITFPDGDRRRYVKRGETFPVPRIDCRHDNAAQLAGHLFRVGDQFAVEVTPVVPGSTRNGEAPAEANEPSLASGPATEPTQGPSPQSDRLVERMRSVGDPNASFYVVTVVY